MARPTSRRRAAYRSGHRAEAVAALSLMLKGYRILARRYRTKVGEIDLVARRGQVLAIVEVKRRADFATGIDAVVPAAQRRIRRAAEQYVRRYPALGELGLRFDIIVITPFRWPVHVVDAWRDW
jgi:putative endonuclease